MNPYEITAQYGPKTIVFEIAAENLPEALKLGEHRARETFEKVEQIIDWHGSSTILVREIRGK